MFYSPHGWVWVGDSGGQRIAIPRDRIYASTLRQGVRHEMLWVDRQVVQRPRSVPKVDRGLLDLQDAYRMRDLGREVKWRLHEADPRFTSRLKVVDLVTGQENVKFL